MLCYDLAYGKLFSCLITSFSYISYLKYQNDNSLTGEIPLCNVPYASFDAGVADKIILPNGSKQLH